MHDKKNLTALTTFAHKQARLVIGLVLIVITFYLAFRGIEIAKVLDALARINLWFLLPAVIGFWLGYAPRVFRWQLLFTPYKLRWSKVLSTLSIGYFLSNITPLRIGDVARAYLIASIEHVPVARSLSSVVIERVSDVLTVVLTLVVLLPFIPNIPSDLRNGGALIGAVGIVAMIAFALLSLQRERGLSLLRRMAAPFPFLQREAIWRALENLIDGFAVLHSVRPLLGVIAWSLIIWFFSAVLNWWIMLAAGIQLDLSAAALVMVGTSLAVAVVPTPGQLGVFHAAAVLVLTQVYNVPQANALAFAFVIHAYVYVWLMILGTLFMWREGLSYRNLQAVGTRAGT